jgi:Leucine-rich repeat (LRR) protein
VQHLELYSSALVDLSAFAGVSLQTGMSLWDNAQLSSLNGAPTLASDASLFISGSPSLTDLSALSALTRLHTLDLSNIGITHLDALSNMTHLEVLYLRQNPNLIQVDGLGQIEGLVELWVSENPTIERLPAFPNVVTIPSEDLPGTGATNVAVEYNSSLADGPSFPALAQAQYISIESNPNLTRVTGFARLEAVEVLRLVNNAVLAEVDFSSLQDARSVAVEQNPMLDSDQTAPLLQLASSPQSWERP